jgi:hypothetical protein
MLVYATISPEIFNSVRMECQNKLFYTQEIQRERFEHLL